MITKEGYTRIIETDANREAIKAALRGLFGTDDIMQITDPSLDTFLADVLPRMLDAPYGGYGNEQRH